MSVWNVSANLLGSGSLAPNIKLRVAAIVSLSGAGTLQAITFGAKVYSTAALVGSGALAIPLSQNALTGGHLTGGGSLVANTMNTTWTASAALVGSGTMSLVIGPVITQQALSGSGILDADSSVVLRLLPLFDYAVTVISQYANSPILLQMVDNFDQCVDQGADWQNFLDFVWNVDTAQGFGLDMWGRIVGVLRILPVITSTQYFGFHEAGDLNGGGFGQDPFYSGQTFSNSYALSDDSFRLLIYAKALANLSDGSIQSINKILQALFPGRGNCYVTDNGNMSMVYTFAFSLTAVEKSIVVNSGVLPKPSGVSVTYSY